MAPRWLTVVAWLFVFPITALYFGPVALWFYWRWGRAARTLPPMSANPAAKSPAPVTAPAGKSMPAHQHAHHGMTAPGRTSGAGNGAQPAEQARPWWVTISAEASHCGIFQYFAIAPMRGLGVKDGLIAAAKADFISLTAFEIGLFGWMAVMALVLFPAPDNLVPSSAAFWLLMQVGMIIGYCTSWPANAWLVKRGIKVPM